MSSEKRQLRKSQKGTVVSNKMQNTVIVEVKTVLRHPKYGKVITRSKKFYAHHEGAPLNVGQEVNIIETRPLSKLKRWRVAEAATAS